MLPKPNQRREEEGAPVVQGVVVTEAGGQFTSLSGEDGPHGGDALASNGALHDAALSALR